MITLKKMEWSNLFSYGENNQIYFDRSPLTQIVGQNGHGKSSIALILEEALYNKNSKNIKKADVLNRNSKAKTYSINLWFDRDGDSYEIKTVRGTTQTVKLLKNGDDISSHTATQTYKTIEELIGYDHKTFTQIVYQSSSASLEFLTATDSNRKKFLIDLLNLTKYVEIGEVFKEAVKGLSEESQELTGKIKTVTNWLDKYKNTEKSYLAIQPVPESPKALQEEVAGLKESVKNIEQTNKKIVQNNKYKELLDNIVLKPVGEKPKLDLEHYKKEKIEAAKAIKDAESFVQKMSKLAGVCPTCLQDIDKDKVHNLISEQEEIKTNNSNKVKALTDVIDEYLRDLSSWQELSDNKKQYEEYHSLYDDTLAKQILDKKELENQIHETEELIHSVEQEIKRVLEWNNKATTHNAKIDVISEQTKEMTESLATLKEELSLVSDRLNTLQILVKTFSSTGLVAYKIECLVKDLEEVTNKYLADLSGGRFQLGFKITSSDKLVVVITDHGKDIEITALSGGERARVNCAALLGIRKLMQSLSNTRINLLILDETIENLDIEGKEKLVEVLLTEEYLNTFVISHGFTHPLLEKVTVTKKNNISRVDYG